METPDELAKKYEFEIKPFKGDKEIDHIVFKDGREYKLQRPLFFDG